MLEKKVVLGKGLEALIPKKPVAGLSKEFTYLPLDKISPGKYQPRQDIDEEELKELSQSIKEKGVIQPIVVRRVGLDNYEIVAGGRRFHAAKLLGIKEIPTMIKELEDKDALIFAIIENLQRKDLNPIEEAEALMRLVEEFEFTQDEIAKFVGKDKTTIANTLRLLKLPALIKDALRKGIINRSQARTILALEQKEDQERLFHEIMQNKLSVREMEQRVKRVVRRTKTVDPFIVEAEDRLQKLLGTRVRIFNRRNNRGRIMIEYYTLKDLERLMKRFA